jgi:hypothetical protein
MTPEMLVTVSLTPVVFTPGDGPEGPDELLAPPSPQAETYTLPVAQRGGPPITRIVGAWHTPVDNVAGITAFARLDVEPSERQPGTVEMTVSAKPGQRGRVRLRVTVLCAVAAGGRGQY